MSVPLTFPFTATGLSIMACIPRMEDWGGLMIGVPIMEPNTPPLEIVNVPPSISSMANSLARASKTENKKCNKLSDFLPDSSRTFRVAFCLCFKTSLGAKGFYFNANQTHLHTKGFTRGPMVLKSNLVKSNSEMASCLPCAVNYQSGE